TRWLPRRLGRRRGRRRRPPRRRWNPLRSALAGRLLRSGRRPPPRTPRRGPPRARTSSTRQVFLRAESPFDARVEMLGSDVERIANAPAKGVLAKTRRQARYVQLEPAARRTVDPRERPQAAELLRRGRMKL